MASSKGKLASRITTDIRLNLDLKLINFALKHFKLGKIANYPKIATRNK